MAHSESWLQGYHDAYNGRPSSPDGWDAHDYHVGYAIGAARVSGRI